MFAACNQSQTCTSLEQHMSQMKCIIQAQSEEKKVGKKSGSKAVKNCSVTKIQVHVDIITAVFPLNSCAWMCSDVTVFLKWF